jgi:hypothetical protein
LIGARRRPRSGKIVAARYFFETELPLVEAWLRPVKARSRIAFELSEAVLG